MTTLPLLLRRFGDRLALELARDDLFRTDVGDPLGQSLLSRLKIDVDQRNAGLRDKLRHLRRRHRIDGVHDDRIHPLTNEGLNLIKLSSDIPLGLHELDLDSQLLCFFRHGSRTLTRNWCSNADKVTPIF